MSGDMTRFLQGDLGISCRNEDDLATLKNAVAEVGVQVNTANWDFSKRGVAGFNQQLNRIEFAPRTYFVTQGMAVVPVASI